MFAFYYFIRNELTYNQATIERILNTVLLSAFPLFVVTSITPGTARTIYGGYIGVLKYLDAFNIVGINCIKRINFSMRKNYASQRCRHLKSAGTPSMI